MKNPVQVYPYWIKNNVALKCICHNPQFATGEAVSAVADLAVVTQLHHKSPQFATGEAVEWSLATSAWAMER